MQTQIIINGKIMSIIEKIYEGKKTVYVQFLAESEARGMEIIKVKITIDTDIVQLQKNEIVAIPVSISCVNNTVYLTQCDAIKKQEVKRK